MRIWYYKSSVTILGGFAGGRISVSTVTSKGQITVPKSVRDALGLVPGSQVDFILGPDGVFIRKRIPAQTIDRWYGSLRGHLPGGADTTDEAMELLRGHSSPGSDSN
jgi:antitoxin PrlF